MTTTEARGAGRDAALIIAATFLSYLGARTAAIALPLVILAQTGSTASMGAVAASMGVPLVLAPWWAQRIIARVDGGARLAGAVAVGAAGHGLVAVAAVTGHVTTTVLVVAGFVVGASVAISGPVQQAMLADTTEALGAAAATRALMWNDFAHRLPMVFAPPLGAVAVTFTGAVPVTCGEAVAVGLSAVLLLGVRPRRHAARGSEPPSTSPRGMWRTIAQYPGVVTLLGVRSVAGVTWFGLSIGLAAHGAAIGRDGILIAAAMSAYGAGSVAGALLVPIVGPRVYAHAVAFQVALFAPWAGVGLMFLGLAAGVECVPWIATVAAIGAVGVPFGIGAWHHRIVTTVSPEHRRTVYSAASSVLEGAAYPSGMAVGGVVVAVLGPIVTLVATGVVQVIAAVTGATAERVCARRAAAVKVGNALQRRPVIPPVRQDPAC